MRYKVLIIHPLGMVQTNQSIIWQILNLEVEEKFYICSYTLRKNLNLHENINFCDFLFETLNIAEENRSSIS